MGIREIEKAIVQLPAKDLHKLASWLEEYRAQMWDEQIEKHLAEGRVTPCRPSPLERYRLDTYTGVSVQYLWR